MRFKLIIEYDGSGFLGWQRQNSGLSVQGSIENAIYKFCQEQIKVHGAGRTDTGVHALGQVAHVDIAKTCSAETLQKAINYHLKPLPIAIISAEKVADIWHARLGAKKKYYVYRICNRPQPLTIGKGYYWQISRPLCTNLMRQGAQYLIGKHDFTSFRASRCQSDITLRTIDDIIIKQNDYEISINCIARSFLYKQVRIIVGTLVEVGLKKIKPIDVKSVLEAKNRIKASVTAPPSGLYLMQIEYD
jgi:tRNA pseudouridine38-40 synthase